MKHRYIRTSSGTSIQCIVCLLVLLVAMNVLSSCARNCCDDAQRQLDAVDACRAFTVTDCDCGNVMQALIDDRMIALGCAAWHTEPGPCTWAVTMAEGYPAP